MDLPITNLGVLRMEDIEWNEWLSLKIPSIDGEHRKLFDYIRKLNERIKNNKGHEVLISVLDGMAQYAGYHFKHKEWSNF